MAAVSLCLIICCFRDYNIAVQCSIEKVRIFCLAEKYVKLVLPWRYKRLLEEISS